MAEEGPTYVCGECREEFGRGKKAFFEYAAHMMDPEGHHMLVCPLRHVDYPDYVCGVACKDKDELKLHQQTHS